MKSKIIVYLVLIGVLVASIVVISVAGIDIFGKNTGEPEHTHSFGEWQTVEEATCTENGSKARACACGEKETAVIDATGHDFVTYTSDENATCTADGTKTAKCECCDKTDTVTEAETKLGHDFVTYISDENATCTEDGTKTAKCERCDKTDTITEAETKFGHNFVTYKSDENATCTEDGTKTAKCERCDETNTVTVADTAIGHSYTDSVVAPTCTAGGYTLHTCGTCGYSYSDSEKLTAAHPYEWELIEAGETTDTYKKTCTVCSVTEIITGVPKASIDLDMEYSEELGGYVVTGIGKCTDTDIVIPTHYQGPGDEKPLPVVAIASATDDDGSPIFGLSFMSNETITSLTIIGEVKTIGAFAFAQTNLKEINILGGVTTIDIQSFSFCYSVQTIVISDSVTNIGDGAFFYAGFATGQSISVYYTGTEEQWKYVDIVYTEGDEAINDATKYFYSETEPTEAGNYWHYVDGVVTVWPAV